MINALPFLNGWIQVTDTDNLVASYNGSFGCYDKTAPYHTLSNQNKFEADRAYMLELLSEFGRLGPMAFGKAATGFVSPVFDEPSGRLHLLLVYKLDGDPKPL